MTTPSPLLKFTPSARARWSKCPYSLAFAPPDPPRAQSEAAREGEAAHALAARVLIDYPPQLTPPPRETISTILCGHPMTAATLDYYAFVKDNCPPPGVLGVEHRVRACIAGEVLRGAIDVLRTSEGQMTVIDYKYGNSPVDVGTAESPNEQLAMYAVMAAASLDRPPQSLKFGIFQPRSYDRKTSKILEIKNGRSFLAETWDRLTNEILAVKEAAAGPKERHIVPGDHCKFCPTALDCPAALKSAAAAAKLKDNPSWIFEMTESEIIDLWKSRKAFGEFQEILTERIKQLAKDGHPRLDVKTSKGFRMWADTKEAALTLMALGLTDCLQPRKLAEVEPKLPRDVAATLVKRSADRVGIEAR